MSRSMIEKAVRNEVQEQVNEEEAEMRAELLAELRKKAAAKLAKEKERIEKSWEREGKKKTKRKLKEASLVIKGDKIYEETTELKFVTLNDGGIKYFDVVDGIYPIESDALEKGVVLLPEKPEDYGTVEELIKEISKHIEKYLDVSEDFKTFAVYYILLSWLYDKTNTVCFLRALGDTGTGKSRFLNVIGRLLYKPCIVSGAVTPAPIYRLVERWKGSLVIDEADFRDSTEKNEVVTILNCRFERGRPVIRCNKDNPDDIQSFEVFGPTIIATRKTFRDKALESRCLTEVMKETRRKDIVPVLDDEFYENEMVLRNKLLKFRFDYFNKIKYDAKIDFDFGEIEPRLKQATSSFIVLFANVPEIAEKFKKFIINYNNDLIEERSNTFEGMVVNSLVSLLNEGWKNIISSDIVEKINNIYKFEVNSRSVGRVLKSLGLKTHPVKLEGKTKKVIVLDADLLGILAERYIPKDTEIYENFKKNWLRKVTKVTKVTTHIGERAENVTVTIKKQNVTSGGHSPVTNVTFVTKVTEILNMIPKNEPIDVEKLVSEAIKRGYVSITNPQLGYDLVEKLKREGLVFEQTPGKVRRV